MRIKQHVVQLEIVMDQRRCRARGNMLGQPARKRFYLGYIVRLGAEVAFDPALYLASKETFGIAEFVQPGRVPIDGMYLHQRFHDRVRKALAEFFAWVYSSWKSVIQDYAFAPLHYVERYSQN